MGNTLLPLECPQCHILEHCTSAHLVSIPATESAWSPRGIVGVGTSIGNGVTAIVSLPHERAFLLAQVDSRIDAWRGFRCIRTPRRHRPGVNFNTSSLTSTVDASRTWSAPRSLGNLQPRAEQIHRDDVAPPLHQGQCDDAKADQVRSRTLRQSRPGEDSLVSTPFRATAGMTYRLANSMSAPRYHVVGTVDAARVEDHRRCMRTE